MIDRREGLSGSQGEFVGCIKAGERVVPDFLAGEENADIHAVESVSGRDVCQVGKLCSLFSFGLFCRPMQSFGKAQEWAKHLKPKLRGHTVKRRVSKSHLDLLFVKLCLIDPCVVKL